MPKSKRVFSVKDSELLYRLWEESMTGNGRRYSVRQLAEYFNCNQPRILKELHYWKGYQRFIAQKEPVIKMDSVSMEEVEKEYGNTT